ALLYMKDEVLGIKIPDALIRRVQESDDAREEGVRIAVEIINDLREIKGIQGIHLMPVMWESIIPRIVKESGVMGE
ncbi:methylenetetrahydrofolate reductase, partial [bacterium]|nr:methylenetetrahydrofolate reductase [bacterium]